MWLCCEKFTIADLSLAMLLHRLYCLGLDDFFWCQKRPIIATYFKRISERESFQKSLPISSSSSTISTVQDMWSKMSPAQIVGFATAISAAVLLVSNLVSVK